MDFLFTQPVLTARDVADLLGISLGYSCKLIEDFEKAGILNEATGFERNRFFAFKEYLDIFHQ